jgi:hypothetical protein
MCHVTTTTTTTTALPECVHDNIMGIDYPAEGDPVFIFYCWKCGTVTKR